MQALREIHDVTSDTVTIQIPKKFPYKQVEIIVLPVEEKGIIDKVNSWEATHKMSKQLEHSKATFNNLEEAFHALTSLSDDFMENGRQQPILQTREDF